MKSAYYERYMLSKEKVLPEPIKGLKENPFTGLKRIKDACDKAGCKVDFETPEDGFVVVFYRHGVQKLSGTAQKNAQKEEKTAQKIAQKEERINVNDRIF